MTPLTVDTRSPLTIVQAAAALNVSRFTVRSWIQQRRIGHIRLGRSLRVPAREVSRLLDAGFVPAVGCERGR